MQVLLDLVGSTILVGTLILSIMGVNVNMTTETFKSTTEFHIQTEVIQLSRIMEFDLAKMGYDVTSGRKIITADSSRLKFKANLWNVPGAMDSVEYILGGLVGISTNPRDRVLTRYENTSGVLINYSITTFRLSYYKADGTQLTTPVTGARLDSIDAVRILMTIESPEPLGTDATSQYASGYYEKLIYPRNL
ncbi:MAG TPA: hypothetical protein VL633_08295 [Bacteroidota bacterium]|nr:hypothetical protein [Bacteroidota bacterium]